MNKILALLCLFLFLPGIFATTGFEKDFLALGYDDLVVTGTESIDCKTFVIQRPIFEEGFFPIISLNIDFENGTDFKEDVNVSLNNQKLIDLKKTDFVCSNGNCWKRIYLNWEKLNTENELKICLGSGKSTQLILKNNSMIGTYETPVFLIDDFIKTVDNDKPFVGEKLNTQISFTNSGSKSSKIIVRHLRHIVEETDEREEVKEIGNTSFEGLINPNETKTINYQLLVRKSIPFSLPPAVIYFENIWGEEEMIYSNIVDVYTKIPQIKLTPSVVVEEITELGRIARARIAVKNETEYTFSNVKLSVNTKALEVQGEKTLIIDEIPGGEISYYDFYFKAEQEGDYEIGCELEFTDLENKTVNCYPGTLSFRPKLINSTVVGGAILLLIGAGIYFYLRFK